MTHKPKPYAIFNGEVVTGAAYNIEDILAHNFPAEFLQSSSIKISFGDHDGC